MGDDGGFNFENNGNGQRVRVGSGYYYDENVGAIRGPEQSLGVPCEIAQLSVVNDRWNRFCMRCAHREDNHCGLIAALDDLRNQDKQTIRFFTFPPDKKKMLGVDRAWRAARGHGSLFGDEKEFKKRYAAFRKWNPVGYECALYQGGGLPGRRVFYCLGPNLALKVLEFWGAEGANDDRFPERLTNSEFLDMEFFDRDPWFKNALHYLVGDFSGMSSKALSDMVDRFYEDVQKYKQQEKQPF